MANRASADILKVTADGSQVAPPVHWGASWSGWQRCRPRRTGASRTPAADGDQPPGAGQVQPRRSIREAVRRLQRARPPGQRRRHLSPPGRRPRSGDPRARSIAAARDGGHGAAEPVGLLGVEVRRHEKRDAALRERRAPDRGGGHGRGAGCVAGDIRLGGPIYFNRSSSAGSNTRTRRPEAWFDDVAVGPDRIGCPPAP